MVKCLVITSHELSLGLEKKQKKKKKRKRTFWTPSLLSGDHALCQQTLGVRHLPEPATSLLADESKSGKRQRGAFSFQASSFSGLGPFSLFVNAGTSLLWADFSDRVGDKRELPLVSRGPGTQCWLTCIGLLSRLCFPVRKGDFALIGFSSCYWNSTLKEQGWERVMKQSGKAKDYLNTDTLLYYVRVKKNLCQGFCNRWRKIAIGSSGPVPFKNGKNYPGNTPRELGLMIAHLFLRKAGRENSSIQTNKLISSRPTKKCHPISHVQKARTSVGHVAPSMFNVLLLNKRTAY